MSPATYSGPARPGTGCTRTASAATRRAPIRAAREPHPDPGTLDLWMTEASQ